MLWPFDGYVNSDNDVLSLGIQTVFIFDEPAPELKADELAARRERRLEAEAAQASTGRWGLPDRSKDGTTHRPLWSEMVEDTKQMLDLLVSVGSMLPQR